MNANPSSVLGPARPVEQVTWSKAATFCQQLSQRPAERCERRRYRLPTEAEWEYACRAGTSTAYGFGNDPALLEEFAWYAENSAGRTHTVGQKQPNQCGLYDLHGNVWDVV